MYSVEIERSRKIINDRADAYIMDNSENETDRIAELESDNAALRAALEFYADAQNYTAQQDAHGHKRTPIMVYKWKTARAALVKARGAQDK